MYRSWNALALLMIMVYVALLVATALASQRIIGIWDSNSAYVSSQPWWIALPSILAWCALFMWLLLELPWRRPIGNKRTSLAKISERRLR